jgi:predicted AlkP superfamily phosphohydrolase/phosphomutase
MRTGRMLSGLGVPDVRGTNSTFTYAGSDVTEHSDLAGGSEEPLVNGHFALAGPALPQTGSTQHRTTTLDVVVRAIDATHLGVKLGDAAELSLAVGTESDAQRVVFDAGGANVHGVLTLTALEAQPAQRLFVSPIGMDPHAQWTPIAYPQRFAEELEHDIGRTYKTVGWDHDTSALNTEVIDDGTFLAQMDRIETDRQRMLLARMSHDDWDLMIWVSTATDRAAHMFYRLIDPQHPRYDAALAARYGDAIERQYRRMDDTVGRVLGQLHPDDTLLVISDHGFHDYRRGLHVNQWLRQQGLLFLKNDVESSDVPYLLAIDWSRTKAYSLGTGQIYVNLRGRERDGIVNEEDAAGVERQIRDGLLALRDSEKENAQVVDEVYLSTDVFRGARHADAPDLQIAFAENYRTSWETTLGGVPAGLFADNTQKWSGDHAASDVRETPGILVSNRAVARDDPAILDLAPTATRFFGRTPPAHYTGRSFLAR